jgi:hypothetical protein
MLTMALFYAFNGIMTDLLYVPVMIKTNALGGEDGQLKIWSKNGMLRSVLVQTGKLFSHKYKDIPYIL